MSQDIPDWHLEELEAFDQAAANGDFPPSRSPSSSPPRIDPEDMARLQSQFKPRLAMKAKTKPKMDSLPEEVLMMVFTKLDNPSFFSQVSSYFHDFSTNTFVRASYFLTRYSKCEAIFQALYRPKLFNKELLGRLLAGGAILSRGLVQAVATAFVNTKHQNHHHHYHMHGMRSNFGKNLTFEAFAAVMDAGAKKFGNGISMEKSDSSLFYEWLQGGVVPFETIAEIFVIYKYMPLVDPTLYEKGMKDMSATIVKAISKEPKILQFALANGLDKFSDSSINSIVRSLFARTSAEPQKIVQDLKELTSNDDFYISKTVASQVIMSNLNSVEVPNAYTALKMLQYEPNQILPFNLKELAKQVVASLVSKRFDADVSNFVDRMVVDFPSVVDSVKKFKVISVFLKAEQAFKDLEVDEDGDVDISDLLAGVNQVLGDAEVTSGQILSMLSSNLISSNIALRYASIYVPGFDEASFLETFFEPKSILDQPYKGQLINQLLSGEEELGFKPLLESEIVKRSIKIDLLPIGTRRNDYTFDVKTCRTTMVFDYSRAQQRYSSGQRSSFSRYPQLGFNVVWDTTLGQDSSKKESKKHSTPISAAEKRKLRSKVKIEEEEDSDEDEIPQVEGKRVGSDRILSSKQLGGVSMQSLEDAVAQDLSGRAGPSTIDNVLSGIDNIHGIISNDAVPIAGIVLHHFGPLNPASCVMFSHAILNDNRTIMEAYLESGAQVTLFHFKMLAQLGYEIKHLLVNAIKNGSLFLLEDGTRKQDDGNDEELLASRATLNAEEKKKVKAGAKTRATGRRGEFNSTALRAINPNATASTSKTTNASTSKNAQASSSKAASGSSKENVKAAEPRSDSPLTEEEELKVVDEPKKKQEDAPPGVRRSGRTSIKIHQQMDQDEDEEMSEGEQVGKKVESDEQEDSNSDSEEEDEDDERREISVLQNESDDEETIYLLDDNEPTVVSRAWLLNRKRSLVKWISHLNALLKQEKRKHEVRRLSTSQVQVHRNPYGDYYEGYDDYGDYYVHRRMHGKVKTERVPFHLDLDQKVLPVLKAKLAWLNKSLDWMTELRKSRPNPKMVNKQECMEELFDLDAEFKEHHEENGPKWSVSRLPVEKPRLYHRAAFNNSDYSGAWRRGGRRTTVHDQPYENSDDETFDLSEHTFKKTLKLPSKLVDRLSGTEIKKKGKRAARRNRYQPTQSEEEGPEQTESEFKSLEVLYASDSSHTSDSDDEIEVDDEEVRSSKKKAVKGKGKGKGKAATKAQSKVKGKGKGKARKLDSDEEERNDEVASDSDDETDSVPLKKRRVSKEVVVKEEEDLSVSELESE